MAHFLFLILASCHPLPSIKPEADDASVPGTTLPDPTVFDLSITTAGSITIAWVASTQPRPTYKILQSEFYFGPFHEIYSSTKALTYTHTGLTPGKSYFYKVRYEDASGVFKDTEVASGPPMGTPLITSVTPSSSRADFVFPTVTGAQSYTVRYKTTGSYSAEIPIVSSGFLSGLTNGMNYTFIISAKNTLGFVDSAPVSVEVNIQGITSLQFTTAFAPTSTSADTAFTTQATVSAYDVNGLLKTTDSTSVVTLTAYDSIGCGGSAVTGGLSGTTSKTLVNGVGTFTNIRAIKNTVRSISASIGPVARCSSPLTITPGSPTQIAITSGNTQSQSLTLALASPLSVTLKDANGNLTPGATVNWLASSGTLAGPSSTTNLSGVGSNTLTVGSSAGAKTVTATLNGTLTSVSFDFTATLAVPTSLTGAVSDTAANLSFTGAAGATSYNIYRSSTSGSGFTLVTNIATTTYSNTGLTNGTTYYFIVKAVNNSIESAASNEVSVKPALIASAPQSLTGSVASTQTVLTWTAPATGSTPLTYTVYKSSTSGSGFTALVSSVSALTFTDTGLANGTTYYYKIAASNTVGEGSFSNEIAMTPELEATLNYDFSAAGSFQPHNRLTYSEELEKGSPWVNNGLSIQQDAAQDPAGGFTAEKIMATAVGTSHFLDGAFSVVADQTVTGSIYLKKGESDVLQVWLGGCATWTASTCPTMSVNLTTGTLYNLSATVLRSSLHPVGNSWFRVTLTATASAIGTPTLRLVHPSNGVTGDGISGFYAWGAQVENHPGVSRYVKTTSSPMSSFTSPLTPASGPSISFARSDVEAIATVYGSDGKLRFSPHNVYPYSQDANNWSVARALVTANATTAPDGTMTADKVIASSSTVGGTNHAVYNNTLPVKAGAQHTFSVYLKTADYSNMQIKVGKSNWANNISVDVNMTTGALSGYVVTGTIPSYSAVSTPVGNGWYRVAVTVTLLPADTLGMASLYFLDGTLTPNFTGDDTSGFYVWGAQFEKNMNASTYLPTGSSARYDAPRFDFNPMTLLPKGFMFEANRTNSILYSSDFSQTEFGKLNTSVALSAELAPDGTPAYKLTEAANTTVHSFDKTRNGNNETLTFSLYAKAAGRTSILLQQSNLVSNSADVRFDLTNCTVAATTAANADYTGIKGDAFAVGNGWCRLSITVTKGSAQPSNSPCVVLYNGGIYYAGDGSSGVYLWGAQLEDGDTSTSYMPTTGTAVNRRVERSEFTSAPWYTTSGTWRVNWQHNQTLTANPAVALASNTFNSGYYYLRGAVSNLGPRIVDEGGVFNDNADVLSLLLSAPTVRTPYSAAFAYNTMDLASSFNGGAIRTASSASVILPTTFYLGSQNTTGSNSLNGTIKSFQFFNSRLSNAELVRLSGQLP